MSTPVFIQSPNARNRPMSRRDAQGVVIPNSFADMSFRGEYTGTNLIYKGLARPGADESASVWQISKLSYDGSNNLLTVKWPQDSGGEASNDYQFSWTDRATYTYS